MPEAKRPGRPEGKRSSNNYMRITAYLTKRTYRRLKAVLAYQDAEISEVVQQLIDDWLEKQKIQFPEEEDEE
jgi:hypothetical protein